VRGWLRRLFWLAEERGRQLRKKKILTGWRKLIGLLLTIGGRQGLIGKWEWP